VQISAIVCKLVYYHSINEVKNDYNTLHSADFNSFIGRPVCLLTGVAGADCRQTQTILCNSQQLIMEVCTFRNVLVAT